MNNYLKFLFIIICFSAVYNNTAKSQEVTYSPYSIFGIGELELNDLGRNSGMGNVGIGIQSIGFLNRINPASLSSLDSITFTLELSYAGKYSKFNSGADQQKNFSTNFKKIAMGFRISRLWSMSLGLVPYSYTGYDINTSKYITGTMDKYTVNLTGTGAINKLYTGHSFAISKNLSLGIDLNVLFGTLTKTQTSEIPLNSSIFKYEQKSYLFNLNFDYGIQYSNNLGEKLSYTVGSVFGLNNNTKLKNSASLFYNLQEETLDQKTTSTSYVIPWFVGAGFSLKHISGITFASDYYFQKWSGNNTNYGQNFKYVDNKRISMGLEYQPAIRIPKNYLQRMFYQAGFCYNQSYLMLRGKQINQISFSAGLGFPLKGERSYINISFEKGTKGRIGYELFQENYSMININLIFRDFWFMKSQFD